MSRLLLGVDPGWVNLGYALLEVSDDGVFSIVETGVQNPSLVKEDYPDAFSEHISLAAAGGDDEIMRRYEYSLSSVTIERYVPYNNTFSAEAENITMLIGGLRQCLRPLLVPRSGVDIGTMHLVRAIDWKTELVKILVKNFGFDNPSTSLDKKFSIAAAKHILNGKGDFNSDHEADAICLAVFPDLKQRFGKKPRA